MSNRKLGCIVLTYEALARALHLDSEDAVISIVPPDSGDLANQTVRITNNPSQTTRRVHAEHVSDMTPGFFIRQKSKRL